MAPTDPGTPPDVQSNRAAPAMPIQPPAQPAAPSPAAGPADAPTPPGSFFRNTSHAFMGAVLGALAGRPQQTYKVDNDPNSPNFGETMATTPTQSHGDQLKSIAGAALRGLAAGAQVPNKPYSSKLAQGLAGIGAGGAVEQQHNKDQDILKRNQASAEFEQQQRAKVNQMNIAHLNATTMREYFDAKKTENDLNPLFATNKSIAQGIQDSPELGHVMYMSADDAGQRFKNDPEFAHTHAVLPLGWQPQTDSSGQPLLDPKTHQPLMQMQMAVIPEKDGNVIVNGTMASDVQKYGEMAGIQNAENFKAGEEVPLNQYLAAKSQIGAVRVKVQQGWNTAKDVIQTQPDGSEKIVKMNPVTQETRPYPEGTEPNVENKTLKGSTEGALRKLETDPGETAGPKAESALAMATARIEDPTTPKAQLARWKAVAAQAQFSMDLENRQKQTQAKLTEAAKDGDPKAAAELLVSGAAVGSQLASNRKPEFTTQMYKEAEILSGGKYNPAKAEADFKIAGNNENRKFFGSANSLIKSGGTLDQLAAIGNQLPAQTAWPDVNNVEDIITLKNGNGPLAGYAATLLAVADDYGKVMGGGTASDSSRHEAEQLAVRSFNPAQRAYAIKAMRDGVGSQVDAGIGKNPFLKMMYDPDSTWTSKPTQQPTKQQNPPSASGVPGMVVH